MTYDGKLYGLPMQSQLLTMVYRKDLFEKNGLTPPTTFEELGPTRRSCRTPRA